VIAALLAALPSLKSPKKLSSGFFALFHITGELFTLAFRPLTEAFGLQLFRSRRQKLYLWCYPLSISSRLCLSRLTTLKRKPTNKVPPNMTARNRDAMLRARTFSRGMDQIPDIAKFVAGRISRHASRQPAVIVVIGRES
jgi:hypothetical protein